MAAILLVILIPLLMMIGYFFFTSDDIAASLVIGFLCCFLPSIVESFTIKRISAAKISFFTLMQTNYFILLFLFSCIPIAGLLYIQIPPQDFSGNIVLLYILAVLSLISIFMKHSIILKRWKITLSKQATLIFSLLPFSVFLTLIGLIMYAYPESSPNFYPDMSDPVSPFALTLPLRPTSGIPGILFIPSLSICVELFFLFYVFNSDSIPVVKITIVNCVCLGLAPLYLSLFIFLNNFLIYLLGTTALLATKYYLQQFYFKHIPASQKIILTFAPVAALFFVIFMFFIGLPVIRCF